MIKIIFPPYQPKIKTAEGKKLIFDGIRRRWVPFTPEEWVRQNFIQYLVQSLRYPPSLISVEKELKLGDLTKRYDIVLFNSDTNPFAIVECKDMNVPLEAGVLDQALRYNISLPVPYLVITNGSHTYAWRINGGKIEELAELPMFEKRTTDG